MSSSTEREDINRLNSESKCITRARSISKKTITTKRFFAYYLAAPLTIRSGQTDRLTPT